MKTKNYILIINFIIGLLSYDFINIPFKPIYMAIGAVCYIHRHNLNLLCIFSIFVSNILNIHMDFILPILIISTLTQGLKPYHKITQHIKHITVILTILVIIILVKPYITHSSFLSYINLIIYLYYFLDQNESYNYNILIIPFLFLANESIMSLFLFIYLMLYKKIYKYVIWSKYWIFYTISQGIIFVTLQSITIQEPVTLAISLVAIMISKYIFTKQNQFGYMFLFLFAHIILFMLHSQQEHDIILYISYLCQIIFIWSGYKILIMQTSSYINNKHHYAMIGLIHLSLYFSITISDYILSEYNNILTHPIPLFGLTMTTIFIYFFMSHYIKIIKNKITESHID